MSLTCVWCIPDLRLSFNKLLHWDEWFKMSRVCKRLHGVISGRESSDEERKVMFEKYVLKPLEILLDGWDMPCQSLEETLKSEIYESSYHNTVENTREPVKLFLTSTYSTVLLKIFKSQLESVEHYLGQLSGRPYRFDNSIDLFSSHLYHKLPKYAKDLSFKALG